MTIPTTGFDPMAHLGPEDHAELLSDALATGKRAIIISAIREIARARGMSELAEQGGIGRSTLYKALAEDGNPTVETLLQVISALRLQLAAVPVAVAVNEAT